MWMVALAEPPDTADQVPLRVVGDVVRLATDSVGSTSTSASARSV